MATGAHVLNVSSDRRVITHNHNTHYPKDGHLHVCKPVANFGRLSAQIAKGWKYTKVLDAAKLEWITHSKGEPATSTDLAAQRQFGEALDAGQAEWSAALDAAVELVQPRGKFTVGDWVQSPWHYNHLGFHETESLFSSGERFRQGCKRCCRPFYERQWILYPPDVWSTKNGRSVKEAKATYHQRWWYARADPPRYPDNWIAPLKLDDLFNEAWGEALNPEDESKWEDAMDVPAGVEPNRSAPKWTRTKKRHKVNERDQQRFVAARQAQYIDNLGVRNEDEGYKDPELAKHFKVVWDNNLTATGTGALIPATVALDQLKYEALEGLDMDKQPAGGTVTYRAYWNEGYTDGSQIAIRQGRLGGGRAVRFGMDGYRLERYNKYSNVCQDCKAVLATRKRWAPSLPRPVRGGVLGMDASEKEHSSALERAVERMKRAAAAKKAKQPEQTHEPHGWTTGAPVRDFEEFQKGPLTSNKYARSGGPTVVTQDLTEALGRLTVIKDKAGDVTLALKAVRRVLGMPSDEPPWTDLDPLEQGARRSAFRKALEEMRRFLENKKQLLINGPSRTSAVDPEETRLELRDEPPYVWYEKGTATVADERGRLTNTAEGEWRGSLVVFERFEYSPRQKKLAYDAIKAGSDESVWKDVMQGVRRRLHMPDDQVAGQVLRVEAVVGGVFDLEDPARVEGAVPGPRPVLERLVEGLEPGRREGALVGLGPLVPLVAQLAERVQVGAPDPNAAALLGGIAVALEHGPPLVRLRVLVVGLPPRAVEEASPQTVARHHVARLLLGDLAERVADLPLLEGAAARLVEHAHNGGRVDAHPRLGEAKPGASRALPLLEQAVVHMDRDVRRLAEVMVAGRPRVEVAEEVLDRRGGGLLGDGGLSAAEHLVHKEAEHRIDPPELVRGVEQAESGADERALVLDRPVGGLACHREEVGLQLAQYNVVKFEAGEVGREAG